MCAREYDLQVPFGVVPTDQHRIVNIDEKTMQRFFVNSGIYVLNGNVLPQILSCTFLDKPALFEKLAEQDEQAIVFPFRENWMDIGKMEDFRMANGELDKVFS